MDSSLGWCPSRARLVCARKMTPCCRGRLNLAAGTAAQPECLVVAIAASDDSLQSRDTLRCEALDCDWEIRACFVDPEGTIWGRICDETDRLATIRAKVGS